MLVFPNPPLRGRKRERGAVVTYSSEFAEASRFGTEVLQAAAGVSTLR